MAKVARGLATSGGELINVLDKTKNLLNPFDDKGFESSSNAMPDVLKKLEAKYQQSTKEGISKERLKEKEALQNEVANSKGLIDSYVAMGKNIADTVLNPSEWTVQGIAAGASDVVNLIGMGSGAIAGRVGKSIIAKIMAGAGAGAITQGGSAGVYGYAKHKDTGVSHDEAMANAKLEALGGVLFGAGFGAFAGASAKIKVKSNTKQDSIQEVNQNSTQNIKDNDSFYADIQAQMKDLLNVVDEIENETTSRATKYNDIILKDDTFDTVREKMNSIVPSQREQAYTLLINDAQTSNRFAGMGLRNSVIKSIDSSTDNIKQIPLILKKEGVSDDIARVVVKSVQAKDITLFDNYIDDIVSVKFLEYKGIKNETKYKNDVNRPDGENAQDVSIANSGDNTIREPNTRATNTKSNKDDKTKLSSLSNDIRGDSGIQQDEISQRVKQVGGFRAFDADGNPSAQSVADTMVSNKSENTKSNISNELTRFAKLPHDIAYLTKSNRLDNNQKIRDLLDENRALSKEELKQVSTYSGWGGLDNTKPEALTQHFTPAKIVDRIYQVIEELPLEINRVLEPSAGVGAFVKNRKYDFTTVDIDTYNSKALNALFPQNKHYHNSYENIKTKGFDLIISNVPFVEQRDLNIRAKNRPDIKTLHDYYFIHSLDKVVDDGVIAFIAPRGVMDNVSTTIRSQIVKQADVIGAFRLGNNTFANAHTKAQSDIIFLQKRGKDIDSRLKAQNEAFVNSDGRFNSYYKMYPDKVLGEIKSGVDRFGKDVLDVVGSNDLSLIKDLDYKKYQKLSENGVNNFVPDSLIYDDYFKSLGENNILQKNKSDFLVKDGNIFVRSGVKTFNDIDGVFYLYEKNIDSNLMNRYDLLLSIENALELGNKELAKSNAIRYKTLFKRPVKDNVLNILGKDFIYEADGLFTDNYELSPIFTEQTKYTNSGVIDIDFSSKLEDRAKFNESSQGIIDKKSLVKLSDDEVLELVINGQYMQLDENTIQSSILYLSGNIAKKIKQLENSALSKDIRSVQLARLQEVLPSRVVINDIDIKGTEKWLLDLGVKIFDFSIIQKKISLGDNGSRIESKYKTNLGDIFDKFLNDDNLISLRKDETTRAYDYRYQSARNSIQETLKDIKASLSDENIAIIEDEYNLRNSSFVVPDYSKLEYLIKDTLDAINPSIKLSKIQKDFIIKSYIEGKGINAHDVGGGKTFSAIVLAKVLASKGISKKPLFIVPAKVIKNWVKEIKILFPKANIVQLGALSKNTRTKKLLALGRQNADYILISHEGFGKLKLPKEYEHSAYRKLLEDGVQGSKLTGRAKVLQEKKMSDFLKKLILDNDNKSITLDKLGVDALFVDEARAFKNVGFNAKIAGSGIAKPFVLGDTLNSASAHDFRVKANYISSENHNKNIFLFDATPTPNKPMELYTNLLHLSDDIFTEYGIYSANDFANRFLERGSGVNPNSNSVTTSLVAIKNRSVLMSIIDRYFDVKKMSDFTHKLPENKIEEHYLDLSDDGVNVFNELFQTFKESKSDPLKRKAVLGIYSEIIGASSDIRNYKKHIPDMSDRDSSNNKIDKVVQMVSDVSSKDTKAGQIIFLDRFGATSDNIEGNLHTEIKEMLIKKGYKREEIAIINGDKTTNAEGIEKAVSGASMAKAKQGVVDRYNDGFVKVVIGTTKSAGEGMNIQKYTTDIYHLDMPWTFGEVVQRNGRGVRRGNLNDVVNSHYLFTRGTFDNLMYKTVMNKKGWNEALWSKEGGNRLEVDIDEGAMASPAQMTIAMEKDPIKQAQLKKEFEVLKKENEINDLYYVAKNMSAEVGRVETKISSYARQVSDLQDKIKLLDESRESKMIATYNARIKKLEGFAFRLKDTLIKAKKEEALADSFYQEAKSEFEEYKNGHLQLDIKEVC